MNGIPIKLVYDGAGPVTWSRKPGAFGLQDKAGVLHGGVRGPAGSVVFDLTLQLKSEASDAPVFVGPFVHGPPTGRFLYLAWRDERGGFAQRLKLPLGTIAWSNVRAALAGRQPLVGTLVDHHPEATSTGVNIGGSRPISWAPASSSGESSRASRPRHI